MPIDGIRIAGFKSFRDEHELDIRPLTILAGRNSTGKSTLMQPLLLLKQTLEAPFEASSLVLDGACVRVADSRQLFWSTPSSPPTPTWSLAFETEVGWWGTEFGRRDGTFGAVRSFGPGWEAHANGTVKVPARGEWPMGISSDEADRLEARRSRIGWSALVPFPGDSIKIGFSLDVSPILDLIHLPGIRGRPERHYPTTGTGPRFPGPFPIYTASLLASWEHDQDPRLRAVANSMERLGLTGRLRAELMNETRVEIQVGRLPKQVPGHGDDLVNIADVGFGTSQVLPVIVALQAAAEGQLVHIEQPELHLHPQAQVVMGELLVEAANRGARLVVETHSPVLLKAVQIAVAKGRLAPEDLALHWFERDEEGATLVKTRQIDSDGTYGDWPIDFADVELDVESEFIRAAMG